MVSEAVKAAGLEVLEVTASGRVGICHSAEKIRRTMHQFFVEAGADRRKRSLIIEGTDVNHIRNVLRMKAGGRDSPSAPGSETQKFYRCEVAESRPESCAGKDHVDAKRLEQNFRQRSICFRDCQRAIKWS